MRPSKLILPVVAIVIAVILVLSFVREGKQGPDRLLKLKVGYIPITECAHLDIGIAKHFFEDEGIQLELQPMKGGATILPAIQEGSLDMGFANVVSLIALDSRLQPDSPAYLVSPRISDCCLLCA